MAGPGPNLRFVTSASLWPPRLVSEDSAWNEHIPFAGWIIEAARPDVFVELGTHTGVSYFAFCESVLRLDLPTDCYAVDTWLGDEHSGRYGEEVFRDFRDLNSEYYESFSRIVRMTFDEAADNFEDSSIDLLHIDGLHTYESVRGDFERWLPRLSGRGLVLMHDTNERKADFGVHRYFKELSERYGTFEFTHGHGLGVVCVGEDQPQPIRDLLALDDQPEGRQARSIYEALGRRISAELSVSTLSQRLADSDQNVERIGRELERRHLDIDRQHLDIERLTEDVVAGNREISEQTLAADQLAGERDALAGRLVALTEENDLLSQRVADIEASTSWRLTAPFRYVADRLKSLVRRVRRSPKEADSGVKRIYDTFEPTEDLASRRRLNAHYRRKEDLPQTLVSIIMPTHDRADEITAAIESVTSQTHQNWELVIIDDGSLDDTAEVVAGYMDDPRFRYLQVPWGGVSRARNAGLDMATGSVISFLDSDNEWDPDYLQLMVAALDIADTDIAYSGMRLLHDGSVVGYRGHAFDWEECLAGNYIDLNVVCHRRSITDDGARFDETLRRMVDWDYLLAITKERDVTYEAFVGADYTFHSSPDQISETEVRLYGKLVNAKHGTSPDRILDSRSALRRIPLDVAICIAAPRVERNHWGDYHFAVGLSHALERKGHAVELVYHDEEVNPVPDLVISLRGLTHHEPAPESVSVLWSISHPDLLSSEETDSFDLVFSASLTWPEALRWSGSRPVHVLPQATDRARFFPSADEGSKELLFVGNSRGSDRPMVSRAIIAGLPLSVFGQGWEGRIAPEYVKGDYLPNEDLSAWYGSAGAVLNDHWDSMREYGYISNRIFDVVAAGGAAISDHLPSIHRVFGDTVATASTSDEMRNRFEELNAEDHDRVGPAIWALRHHSFDNRIDTILSHVEDFVLGTSTYRRTEIGQPGCEFCATEAIAGSEELSPSEGLSPTLRAGIYVRGDTRSLRVAVIPQPAGSAVTSSAFIRLVQPLTSEIDDLAVKLIRVRPDGPDASPLDLLADVDAVIVSRTAFSELGTAQRWADAAGERGIPLVLDTDDAFHLMDEKHPEFDAYQHRLDAYSITIDRAAEVWCSTAPLAESLPGQGSKAIVVPNSIDPRLWRRYRRAARTPIRDESEGLQLLYAGTATHGADLGELVPVFDELADEFDLRLTIAGIAENLPERPWLRRISPGNDALYPRYARWLRERGSMFDVGIAPLVDHEFNRLKSDIKLLEYLAIGLVPLTSSLDPYSESDLALPLMLCDTPEQWLDRLRALAANNAALVESRALAYQQREAMWLTRNAATTGAFLTNRLVDLVDRAK